METDISLFTFFRFGHFVFSCLLKALFFYTGGAVGKELKGRKTAIAADLTLQLDDEYVGFGRF